MAYSITQKFILRSDRLLECQVIPLYDFRVVAGIHSLFVGNEISTDEIQITDLPACDGAVEVMGDSMEPLLKPGDIVLYKTVPNRRGGLYFGEMYLVAFDVDGEEYVTVKYVHRSTREGYYILKSENSDHPPREIPISDVRAMAIIKASIRRYALSKSR